MHLLEARWKCANAQRSWLPWLVVGLLGASFAATAQTTVNINCGGNQYTASDGTVWIGDKYSVGGSNYWASQNVGNTADSWLYRSARYDPYSDFSYSIPVTNANYKVKLKFSENHFWGSGYRVFHVDINGTRLLSNFDIAAAAGGARLAVDKEFTVNVTTGKVDIKFVGVKEKGMISAIQVTPAGAATGGSTPATPVSVSVSPQSPTVQQGATQQFTASVGGSSNTGVSWSVIGSAPAGSINSSGLFTAPSGLSASKNVTIMATSLADPTKSGSSNVTINVPTTAPAVPTVSLTVSPSSTSVTAGNTAQFTASVSGTSNTNVTWSATAGSISTAGLFTSPSVTVSTSVTITAKSVADTSKTATATVVVNPVAVAPSGAWVESNGLLSIEAENGKIINRNQSWNFHSNQGGFSGSGYLGAEPNNNNTFRTAAEYVGVTPEVQFTARFTRTGTYYVWIRGYGPSDVDDSLHVGLDGAAVATGETISQFPLNPSAWGWSSYAMDYVRRATIVVPSAGLHTVNVWVREDGILFDKIVLTTDSAYTATGNGPAESTRELTSVSGPALTLSTNTLTFTGTPGGSNPAAKTVQVSNTGTGTMSWTAASNQGWLQVSPGSGTNAGTLTITPNISGLAAGSYSGGVTVSAPGSAGTPQTVTVNLTLAAAPSSTTGPSMTLSTNSVSLVAIIGTSTPATQNVNLTFSSGSPTWATADNQPWLSVSPSSGAGNATLTLSANPAGLSAGTYTDVVSVTAPGALNSPSYINVTFTVQAAPVTSSSGRNFYIATNGTSSGDGSIGKPWSFPAAMAAVSTVKPGDIIWVRGGTYGNGKDVLNVRFLGTESAPIIIRGYPGERATVQHPMIIGCCDGAGNPSAGQHIWLWGLELTSPITDRTGCPSGPPCYASSNINPAMHVFAPGARIVNCIIHDTMQGISMWREAVNGEAYGNVIYHNGFHASDRGHGHGIYTQNNEGQKKLRENIVFNQFGWGLHLYGSSEAWVRNFLVEGNVSFNNGSPEGYRTDNIIVAGGQGGGAGIIVKDNHFYHTPELQMGYNEVGWQWSSSNEDASVTNNYFIGGRDAYDMFAYKKVVFTGNTLLSYANQFWLEAQFGTSGFTWDNNKYYGKSAVRYRGSAMDLNAFKSQTGLDKSSTYSSSSPTGIWTFVRPNRCEAGRGNITIYNWNLASTVQVDLSSILTSGMKYEIRDAQNFFKGPILQGTYNGGQVTIPMTGLTLAAPNGTFPYVPTHTGPAFGTFIVLVPGSSSRTC